jgi:hypothetical protein
MNAGHAWRKSSFSHAGNAANETGFNSSPGCAAGFTGGGVVMTGGWVACCGGAVVQAVMLDATKIADTSKLVRVNDIEGVRYVAVNA